MFSMKTLQCFSMLRLRKSSYLRSAVVKMISHHLLKLWLPEEKQPDECRPWILLSWLNSFTTSGYPVLKRNWTSLISGEVRERSSQWSILWKGIYSWRPYNQLSWARASCNDGAFIFSNVTILVHKTFLGLRPLEDTQKLVTWNVFWLKPSVLKEDSQAVVLCGVYC